MEWNEAITAGTKLAGVSFAELRRRLGYEAQSTINQWRRADRVASIINFCRILDALGISGGYDGKHGWWVALPEDVVIPKKAVK